MLDQVLRQVSEEGRTVVMTSHDLARAADLAGRFDVLSRGSIQASTRAADLPRDGLLAFYRRALEEARPAEKVVMPPGMAS
jgi:heme exporter protein A